MARKRIIDTDLYFDVEICNLLGDRGLHLYFRLWGIADDSGVYEPRYADIALKMGALNFSHKEVENYIQKLVDGGKVIPFVSNGTTYHWLKNLLKHQPLNNPSPPKYPLPDWISCKIRKYPSGKKFAVYHLIEEKLPEITSSLPVDYPSVKKKRKETKRNKTKKDPSAISEEIAVLTSKLFLGEEKELFNQVVKAISSTRKRGKVSPSIILTQLKEWEKYTIEQVHEGIRIYLEKACHREGKDEKYLLGIIRKQKTPHSSKNGYPEKSPAKKNGNFLLARRQEMEAVEPIPCPAGVKPDFVKEGKT